MSERKPSKRPVPERDKRSREEVLSDFRKIAGPLRGRNRDEKPKPSPA
jgi:hypothetical protein